MEWLSFSVHTNDVDKRLDTVCKKLFIHSAYHSIMRCIRKNLIKINKKRSTYNYRVQLGDTINIAESVSAMLSKHAKNMSDTQGVELINTPLQKTLRSQTIYQTTQLLAVNKIDGQQLFGAHSIMDALQGYAPPSLSFKPAPCHRLDTGTSGLLLCALSADMARYVTTLQQNTHIHKVYIALLEHPTYNTSISHYLYRDTIKKTTYAYAKLQSNIPVHYKALGYTTLHLHTYGAVTLSNSTKKVYPTLIILDGTGGKTHQIRAQCRAHNTSLWNDIKYSATTRTSSHTTIYSDFFLHAGAILVDAQEPHAMNIPLSLRAPIPTRWYNTIKKIDYEVLRDLDLYLDRFVGTWDGNLLLNNFSDAKIDSTALYTSLFGGVIG